MICMTNVGSKTQWTRRNFTQISFNCGLHSKTKHQLKISGAWNARRKLGWDKLRSVQPSVRSKDRRTDGMTHCRHDTAQDFDAAKQQRCDKDTSTWDGLVKARSPVWDCDAQNKTFKLEFFLLSNFPIVIAPLSSLTIHLACKVRIVRNPATMSFLGRHKILSFQHLPTTANCKPHWNPIDWPVVGFCFVFIYKPITKIMLNFDWNIDR